MVFGPKLEGGLSPKLAVVESREYSVITMSLVSGLNAVGARAITAEGGIAKLNLRFIEVLTEFQVTYKTMGCLATL